LKNSRYTGVLPPITTPFVNDEVALNKLKHNLERYNKTGLSGYVVLGSNGEYVFLNGKEKLAVLEAAREAIPKDRLFMAGTGMESTQETIRLTNRAADLGADCALVVTPSYFKGSITPQILEKHYQTIADEARIPIFLYNMPQFTGLNMEPDLVANIATHPNVAGIKDSSGNIAQLSEIIRMTSEDFAVFVGSAPVFFPALCLGAVGGILAAANVFPDHFVKIQSLFNAGNYLEARQLQQNITPLAKWVTSKQGIGGLKMAMDQAGYFGGQPRPPLQKPDEILLEKLQHLMKPFN
jgi:4-hydroxy-2-oxoglutarate aldolase